MSPIWSGRKGNCFKQPLHSPWFYYMVQPVFRQICALWLVLPRSGFCSKDRFHGNSPSRVFFFGAKPANSKIWTKPAKKSEYCHFSQRNYQKKLKRLKFYRDFKNGWRRQTFSEWGIIILKTFDTETETGFTESQEAIKDFINQQKSANTNKKTATDINTLFHYMEAYGIQRSIQRYLSYMKYSFNILKDNEFEKSRN